MPRGVGWIEVITGCMFSGKTEELIKRLRRAQYARQPVVVFKPRIDDRYAEDSVGSHSGHRMRSVQISHASEIGAHIGDAMVVGVDEAQFFPDLVKFCAKATKAGTRVVVAGLDGDFRGRPFGQTTALLPLCDDVSKLAAKCAVCGAPAFFTRRLADSEEQELVGGADIYEPACRLHHGMLDGGDDE